MTQQLWWMVGIVSVVLAGAIGFLLGRRGQGDRLRLAELEEEVERQKEEIAGYKREVESHFDRTASLFTSMAGNYRELFDHLSSGYEKLSGGSARDLFRQRVDAVLLEGSSPAAADAELVGEPTGGVAEERAAPADPVAPTDVDPVAAGMAGAADAPTFPDDAPVTASEAPPAPAVEPAATDTAAADGEAPADAKARKADSAA